MKKLRRSERLNKTMNSEDKKEDEKEVEVKMINEDIQEKEHQMEVDEPDLRENELEPQSEPVNEPVNISVMDKYFPFGLETADTPVDETLLFLFKIGASLGANLFQKPNAPKMDTNGYYEIIPVHKPAGSEAFEICHDQSVRESKRYITVRPRDQANTVTFNDAWPFRVIPDVYLYNSLCDGENSKVFGYMRSPLFRIFIQNRTAFVYLKVDEDSVAQIPAALEQKLGFMLEYFYFNGELSCCEEQTTRLSDTFDFPEAFIPEGFNLQLRDYQLRSVSWMKAIEEVQAKDSNAIHHNLTRRNPQCLMKVKLGTTPYYVELGGMNKISESPEVVEIEKLRFRGGILADDTGSGKTITTLGLIHCNPFTTEKENDRLARFNRTSFYQSRASLILCPENIYHQWIAEAKRCNPGFKITGASTVEELKKLCIREVMDADIVVSTTAFVTGYKYESHIKTLRWSNSSTPEYLDAPGNVAFSWFHFYRLILDEFHEIGSNYREKEFISPLRADYIWGLTGTPQIETIDTQLHFFKPSSRFFEVYKSNRNTQAEFLRKFVKRNVPDLNLPPIEFETIWFDLSPREMGLLLCEMKYSSRKNQIMKCSHYQLDRYRMVELGEFVSVEKAQAKFTERQEQKIEELKQEIIRIKAHGESKTQLERVERSLQSAINSYNYSQNVFKVLGKPDENECRICYETIPVQSLSILPCSHVYCYECISESLKRKRECPLCNQRMDSSSAIYRIREEQPKPNSLTRRLTEADLAKYSSKLIALYNYLANLMEQDPDARIILFLQYSDLASFMETSFKELEIKCARVWGDASQRQHAISRFKESRNGCRLIMMSSEDSVSGMNLTEATHVIILHPFWTEKGESVDMAYEKQGISRAYRFGLKTPLKVVRFAARGTIEEEITLRREKARII